MVKKISKQGVTLESLAAMVANGFHGVHKEMDERFKKVDVRFEQIDVRFDTIDQKIEELIYSSSNHGTQLLNHSQKIKILEKKTRNLSQST